jgi:hypothetical protein
MIGYKLTRRLPPGSDASLGDQSPIVSLILFILLLRSRGA